jgi:hypothetical protein
MGFLPDVNAARIRRSVRGRAFRVLLWRALRRTVPLAAAAGLCLGCFLGMFIADVPWLDRLIIGSPLFGRLLAIVVCPAVALVLADIFIGMEAAMALIAAADQGLDDVWASLGFSPHGMMVSTRRLTLYITAPALFLVAWFAVSHGFGRYLDWVAGKGYLVWMPLLADAPVAHGCLMTLLTALFVDCATLSDIRSAPVRDWQADRRWAFVLRRQFMALACGIAVLGLSFVFFNRWTL